MKMQRRCLDGRWVFGNRVVMSNEETVGRKRIGMQDLIFSDDYCVRRGRMLSDMVEVL